MIYVQGRFKKYELDIIKGLMTKFQLKLRTKSCITDKQRYLLNLAYCPLNTTIFLVCVLQLTAERKESLVEGAKQNISDLLHNKMFILKYIS